MDITAFYEVQNRLYNAAIAGCGILSEDFRLKRAIEGLAPLAEKGKVFAALKAKCEGLLDAGEDAVSQLSDCIALADAVAVTLGGTGYATAPVGTKPGSTAAVSGGAASGGATVSGEAASGGAEAQAAPLEDIIQNGVHNAAPTIVSPKAWPVIGEDASPVKDIPYSLLSEIRISLEKGGESVSYIPKRYPQALLDARFVAKLIGELNGKSSYEIDILAETVLDIYGDALMPVVKASIDFSDEKAKGRQVMLIEHVCGARENAWYMELALDDKIPQQVRLAAIGALVHAPENEAVLMELYQTQKGKVKNAAIEALVRMGAAGIQPYLEKICAKEKISQAEQHLIFVSPSPVCETYAVDRAKQYQQNPEMKEIPNLMAYKTGEQAAEGYFALLDGARKKKWDKYSASLRAGMAKNEEWNMRVHLERMAVDNLFRGQPGAEELIEHLYEKEPATFAGARAYAKLLKGTLAAEDFQKVGGSMVLLHMGSIHAGSEMYEFAVEMAGKLRDTPVVEQYKLAWLAEEGLGKWLGRHYPQAILEVLTQKDALKKEASVILCCNTLVSLCWNSMPEQEKVRYQNHFGARWGAGCWDAELFREYAFPFFETVLKKSPEMYYGCNIYRVMPDTQGREDWYWEWVKRNMSGGNVSGQWHYSWDMELPSDRMCREVDYAIDKLNRQKLLMNKENFNRTMDMLKRVRAGL